MTFVSQSNYSYFQKKKSVIMVNLKDNLVFKLDLTQTFDLDYTV